MQRWMRGSSLTGTVLVLAFVVLFVLQVWWPRNLDVGSGGDGSGSGSDTLFGSVWRQAGVNSSWADESLASRCLKTRLIGELSQDPCYAVGNRRLLKQCNCRSTLDVANRVTYRIPPSGHASLNQSTIEEELLVIFIHINKAGGSTIKKHLLFPALVRNGWDGAGFGMFEAWKGLGEPWKLTMTTTLPNTSKIRVPIGGEEPHFVKCGEAIGGKALAPIFETTHAHKPSCPLRVVWGGMSMGLCHHFPGRPCVYLVVLRDPVARAVSNYNYVCVEGAENRKKWKPEWKAQGRCPLSLLEFFDSGMIEKDFLLWRLTRGCDADCGVAAAVYNLRNPCLRFLLLDSLNDGLTKLRSLLGKPYEKEIDKMLARPRATNKHMYHERVKAQLADKTIMEKVRLRLNNDVQIYEAAKRLYIQQWQQPWTSCSN